MSIKTKTTLFGIIFGLCFPIVAIISDGLLNESAFTWRALLDNHGQQPLLWIIDTAPLVLGVVFFEIGRRSQMILDEQQQAFNFRMQIANDFLTIISHELRTPMNGIIGGVQLAQRANALNEVDAPLDIIADSATDMMALVDDILIYAECVSGRMSVELDDSHLHDILDTLKRHYQKACKLKSLTLTWNMPRDQFADIFIDGAKFTKVLSKLLDNAVKFTPKGSICVDISVDWQTDPVLHCRIEDTGIGIALERIGDLLNPFQQSDTGLQREYGGLGIGLSLAKSLTDLLNGSMTLASEVGVGTKIILKFPLQTEKPEPLNTCKQVESEGDQYDYPILIVEDNIVNQMVLKKMIGALGYKTLVAENGQVALSILQEQTVSLVMMDLQMPVMDGLTCAKSIRALGFSKLPVIALTANIMANDKKSCIAVGMNDYLTKPVKLETLRPVLERYVFPPRKQDSCQTRT